jgi:WD40 repeat protein
MVPSFPLCVRWLDCAPATLGAGSFGAIATFERHIEIWDMNVAEPLRPAAVLQFHEDAVPALAWNVLQRGALLSASVDARAAVWALGPCRPAAVFDVGAPCRGAEWCPADAALFAVAAERGCALFDARQPHPLLAVPAAGGAEVIAWETAGERFAVGDVGGAVALFDRRAPAAPVLRAHAHQAAVTSLALCRAAPVLASTGEDGFCRIWRIEDAAIAPIAEEHMNDGRIYASAFSPDRQTLLAVGGDGEDAQLWDIANLLEGTGE